MDSHAPRSAAARRTSWPGQEGRASPGKDPRAHPAGRRPVSVPCAPWCALLWYDHNHNARAPSALPPLFCLHVYVSTCLRVYMSTCLHVYKLSSKMAYLSAKTDIQRDKQRQTKTGAIKPRRFHFHLRASPCPCPSISKGTGQASPIGSAPGFPLRGS